MPVGISYTTTLLHLQAIWQRPSEPLYLLGTFRALQRTKCKREIMEKREQIIHTYMCVCMCVCIVYARVYIYILKVNVS